MGKHLITILLLYEKKVPENGRKTFYFEFLLSFINSMEGYF